MEVLLNEFSNNTKIEKKERDCLIELVKITYYCIFLLSIISVVYYYIVNFVTIVDNRGKLIDISLLLPALILSLIAICSFFTFSLYINKKDIKFKSLFKILNIFLLKERVYSLNDKNFNIEKIIRSNQRKNIEIIQNGKNPSFKKEIKNQLIYFEKIKDEDLLYYIEKGYYKTMILSNQEISILKERIKKCKIAKISKSLANF